MNKFVLGKKSPTQGYGNMQGKRKVREFNLQTIKPKSKKGLTIFVLFATVVSIKKSVISFKIENYEDVNAVSFSLVMSYDGHSYICRTCDKTITKK